MLVIEKSLAHIDRRDRAGAIPLRRAHRRSLVQICWTKQFLQQGDTLSGCRLGILFVLHFSCVHVSGFSPEMRNDLITGLSAGSGNPRKISPAASWRTGFTTFRMPFVLPILKREVWSGRITTLFSAAELSTLIEVANRAVKSRKTPALTILNFASGRVTT